MSDPILEQLVERMAAVQRAFVENMRKQSDAAAAELGKSDEQLLREFLQAAAPPAPEQPAPAGKEPAPAAPAPPAG